MSLDDLEHVAIDVLKPWKRNARTHSDAQVRAIANSIQKFGWTNPVLIDGDCNIIAGHGRVMAAKVLRMNAVPVLRLAHLSEADRRAYIIADNKLAEKAGWDKEILVIELQNLVELGIESEIMGFEPAEVEILFSDFENADPKGADDKADAMPPVSQTAITQLGDLWVLGQHRILCADAREAESFAHVMDGEAADAFLSDPPYNVKILGNVTGRGRHREFAMASGEMTRAAFTEFLTITLGNASAVCRNGAIAFVFGDWRHLRENLDAGEKTFAELKNFVVWNKTNAGMGSMYRSKHELCFVWKVGDAAHTNTFGLGGTGRYRTNVWNYAGANTFKAERTEELSWHPTVKPVLMLEDAIKDVSKRNQRVLDCFGGSGSTLIAAQRCGRQARLLELDPLYVDVTIRRFEKLTGKQAVLAASGQTFEQVAALRLGAAG